MRVVVLNTQVPFVRGGAEVLVDGLVAALNQAGHQATAVTAPFTWYPVNETLNAALAWRLFDLRQANGATIDRVICTKFPTWAVRHPRKVAWLVHQHRQAYDWHGSDFSEFTSSPDDVAVLRGLREVDRHGLGECRPRYAISNNVRDRLALHTGLSATTLYPPTTLTGLQAEATDDYVLSVARLDRAKRVDLLLQALARCTRPVRAVVVGGGPDEAALRQLAGSLGLGERVRFAGRVPDDELVRLYNRCRALVYAPVDEDYGIATLEAMLAGKPVLTAADSGGTLELVSDGETGAVCPPDAAALALVLDAWHTDDGACRRLGQAGLRRAATITWDRVVHALTGV